MSDKIYIGALGVTDYPQKLIVCQNQYDDIAAQLGKEYAEKNLLVSKLVPIEVNDSTVREGK